MTEETPPSQYSRHHPRLFDPNPNFNNYFLRESAAEKEPAYFVPENLHLKLFERWKVQLEKFRARLAV